MILIHFTHLHHLSWTDSKQHESMEHALYLLLISPKYQPNSVQKITVRLLHMAFNSSVNVVTEYKMFNFIFWIESNLLPHKFQKWKALVAGVDTDQLCTLTAKHQILFHPTWESFPFKDITPTVKKKIKQRVTDMPVCFLFECGKIFLPKDIKDAGC